MTRMDNEIGKEIDKVMEKEIDIDRQKILTYLWWQNLLPCVILAPFCIGFLLAAITVPLLVWYYPRWVAALRFCLDDRSLRVEQGLLFRSRKTIPLDKITDLELVQGPLLRALDMWQIKVQTASTGSQMPEAMLIGVINPEQVREEILAIRGEYLKSHATLVR
ncbi:MAG: PH domain-containing protein [Planctomycetaceae bacterium]|nr:PH domain-containing protein [Planctomycetaceae bacterium]